MNKLGEFLCENEGKGWKVFLPAWRYKGYFASHMGEFYHSQYEYLADEMRIMTEDGQSYTSGFHIFLTKEHADKYKESFFKTNGQVKEVSYKGVLAKGMQNIGCPVLDLVECITTKSMRIL